MTKQLKIERSSQGYIALLVWPETKQRLKEKAKKENKTLIELLDTFSRKSL